MDHVQAEVPAEVKEIHSAPESQIDPAPTGITVLSSVVVPYSALDTSRLEISNTGIDSLTTDLLPIRSIEETNAMPLWYRAFEKMAAVIALLAFALPLLIIGAIVRLGTPGPALFFQQRIGCGGEIFTLAKFRTMYADARERFPELYGYSYTGEEVQNHFFKVDNDPRLTPQGRWLRKSTLDEIPNFLAVLMGHMSLVGPRPEIPEMFPYYKGNTLRKFSVRPGITGLAQTCGRGHLNFHDTVAYDLQYVENRSVWLNIKILCRTVKIVLKGYGAF
ncbi:Undecaprenyl-phosphate galactose phosphotransferase (modular protein) [uncultured Woeseiaceae bacterium]|uniref:Undecaprenyl-phosphate galactose phosphotransferase (Modular protein) n=1 Tax=uncultured Woeseiaceae bacterium TaxID=1983305 RepID=A0A7D9H488_9GAMM|nr:Undecaprenyl-phosphate galactose phosphotransferase (modular protein) [uncultured Woeseiaceae bacterium]